MRSSAHINGHPLHPMLIVFPFAYLFGSACLDVWSRMSGQPRWRRTARDLNGLGLASAVAAALPGLADYLLVVPPRSSAKNRATKHMLANVSALALFAAARRRRNDDDRPGAWSLAAEIAGAALLSTGGYLGGTLVYRNQIGVDHRYADAGKWRETSLGVATRRSGGAIDVAAADELGVDQMKLVRAGGRRIVLGRIETGYVAFDDRCTHRGGPLSDGVLVCGTVQCPWHGSQFDVATGAVKHGPARDPISTYRVFERDGRVWLERPADWMEPRRAVPGARIAGGADHLRQGSGGPP